MSDPVSELDRARLLAKQLARACGAEVTVSVTISAGPDGSTAPTECWRARVPRHVGPLGRWVPSSWLDAVGPARSAANRILVLFHERRFGRPLRGAATTGCWAGAATTGCGAGAEGPTTTDCEAPSSDPALLEGADYAYDRSTNEVDLDGLFGAKGREE